MRLHTLPVLLLLPLAGCGLFADRQSRALRASPDYKAGYSDGCASAGGQDANMRGEDQIKDEALFRTSQAYRAGWSGGLGACRRGRAAPAARQNGPIPDIMPGGGALP
jgi:hypothetical protein